DCVQPIYVGTFHKYMMSVIRDMSVSLKYPKDGELLTKYYCEDVPEAARTALKSKQNHFNKIILDEAQDLITPQYLEIMDLCLEKGFNRGRWTMFGDFSMQAIYSGKNTADDLKQIIEDKTSFIRFKLSINCRNTKPICEEIQTVTGFHAPAELWTKIEGPPVNYITYVTIDEEKSKIEALLKSLLDNHIAEKQITILSPYKRENSIITMVNGYDISEYHATGNDKITFCTIQSYKGLENTVIILIDIDSFESDKLMYVALSRARSGLYIIESEAASKEYLELQRRRFIL
ncbi:MAG: AAA domain-containing protein, partial [Saccharofermentanales bacterium]